jgi:uncharacterized protein YkwD
VAEVGPTRSGKSLCTLSAAVALAAATLAMPFGTATSPAVAKGTGCEKSHARAGKVSRQEARHAVVCLVNHTRRRHGLHVLGYNRKLKRMAQRHTQRMLRQHCFSHQCPGEADLVGRARRVGYLHHPRRWWLGEDLAARCSAARAVRAWMHSPPHRAIVLGSRFHDVGIGVERGATEGGRLESTFTLDVGRLRR